MPKQTIAVLPVGRINRVDPPDEMDSMDVQMRENFLVNGIGKARVNKKMPGSKRFTDGDIGSTYSWGTRYYDGNTAKTFAYTEDGKLYHIDPNGAETAKLTGLGLNKKPAQLTSEIMKVAALNMIYFGEGENGVHSHDGGAGHTWVKEQGISLNPVDMVSHLDRMFYIEDDSEDLIFSANLDPIDITSATDAGIITIGAKRGSKIQKLLLLNETLYIFKEDSIWVLEGRSPSTFQVREVHPSLGVSARASCINTETGVIFLGSDFEFYAFGGTLASTILLSHNISIGGDMTKDVEPLINKNLLDNVTATFHRRLYRCSFVESGQTENDLEWVYNFTNQTDCLTRGNHVSCYIPFTKIPDENELKTGRSDTGYLMTQWYGKNYDDDATSPSMSYKLQTASIGKSIQNKRFTRMWADFQVLGADNLEIGYRLDTRNRASAEKTETLRTYGEQKALTNFINIQAQAGVTDKAVMHYSQGRGQSISFIIDEEKPNIDLSLSTITTEVIVKQKKRSVHVGV